VSVAEVDRYLGALDPARRAALEELRRMILEVVPGAEQVISYNLPAFKVDGEIVAGFAAFKRHLSYLPFSGSVLSRMGPELDGYERTKSSLHFTVERPLPRELVGRLIAVRRGEPDGGGITT
jgi:uncharacterized protein YdhG (YjbR/CyaY superfamily)